MESVCQYNPLEEETGAQARDDGKRVIPTKSEIADGIEVKLGRDSDRVAAI